VSIRDDVNELLDGVPEDRLADVRVYLEHLRDADRALKAWDQEYAGANIAERIRLAVAEAEADPQSSLPHDKVADWVRSWGSENELPSPLEH
jgi:hypothetical protein